MGYGSMPQEKPIPQQVLLSLMLSARPREPGRRSNRNNIAIRILRSACDVADRHPIKGHKMIHFSKTDINTALLAEIQAHFAAADVPAACLVRLSKLYEQPKDTDEWCIVIPMPGKAAAEIDCEDQAVSAQVRRRKNGGRVECLLVAGGHVAIWGAAIGRATSYAPGHVLVLWAFDDAQKLVEYPINEQTYEDLWAAEQVAQSHMHPIESDQEDPADGEVHEYLECLVID
jgi:hypothetical protein